MKTEEELKQLHAMIKENCDCPVCTPSSFIETIRAQPSETPQSLADALTELKAAVEGMRKPLIFDDNLRNPEDQRIHNAACDQFLRLIDEMIRRG